MNENERRSFVGQFVKSEEAIDELIVYTQNKFVLPKGQAPEDPDDNRFIETWETYYRESQESGSFNTLKKYLVQLQFPVKKGISKTEEYIDTTLRGKQKLGEGSLVLDQPDRITFQLYEGPIVGKVPVIIVPNNEDFNTIICALSNKNEPKELPDSMGALFINGINNWDRIHKLRTNWLKKDPLVNWSETFKEHILPKPYLFKDKLIVLSTKGYSGIKSEDMGISEEEWMSSSLIIRREHECAHLFTLQYYGCMANNIHDEIIADYAGITKVLGRFNKEWFMRFMGLEEYPNYRVGARLQNYRSPIQLSLEAFDGLKVLVKKISEALLSFDTMLGNIATPGDHLARIKSICETDMITMASPKGLDTLVEKYNSKVLDTLPSIKGVPF